jgi:hypothetical protein
MTKILTSIKTTNILLIIILFQLILENVRNYDLTPTTNCMAVDSKGNCLPPDQVHSP